MSCRKLIAAGLLLVVLLLPVRAQAAAPPCVPGIKWLFRAPDMCAEELVSGLTSQGMASISGLTFGPGGALYFARPATRAIMRLVPDGRGFFAPPEVFIADLPEPPSGLAYDPQGDTWYIAGDSTIVRAHAGVTETIVRDLPGGAGYWLGNIRIGPDRRLYVAKGSSCDACIESDARRGTLLSFALDGGDMRIVARGLRHSADFDWNPADGTLYILDDERATMPAELNAYAGQPDADFGWPFCDPAGQPVDGVSGASAERCTKTLKPVLTFDPESRPAGLSFYRGEAFPAYKGGLLVALAGSWNATTLAGYELQLVTFGADGKPNGSRRLLPYTNRPTSDATLIRTSFYPYHMAGLTVSPEGWIYVSIAEGRIYRFRP